MRTTVDLPDDIYRAVKVLAAERGTTVRELVLEGLEVAMKARKAGREGQGQEKAPTFDASDAGQETSDEVIGFP